MSKSVSPSKSASNLSPSVALASPRNPQYPPPTSLFLGPPSQNASNISLPSIHQTTSLDSPLATTNPRAPTRDPFHRARSTRAADPTQSVTSPLGRSSQQQRLQRQHQNEGDRTDALWAEMQATLAEVELSAERGTRFFGSEHSGALEELRISQIALAQAWARSGADEIVDRPGESEGETTKAAAVDAGEADKGIGKELEEETEEDILFARKRREANDKYFWRVNSGVLDVVGRLEDVAVAMGKVERQSREIWSSESDSIDTNSLVS